MGTPAAAQLRATPPSLRLVANRFCKLPAQASKPNTMAQEAIKTPVVHEAHEVDTFRECCTLRRINRRFFWRVLPRSLIWTLGGATDASLYSVHVLAIARVLQFVGHCAGSRLIILQILLKRCSIVRNPNPLNEQPVVRLDCFSFASRSKAKEDQAIFLGVVKFSDLSANYFGLQSIQASLICLVSRAICWLI